MIPKEELFEIALAHARLGARRPYRGAIPRLRLGYESCLIGVFIPASSYYSDAGIESKTTYQIRDARILSEEEMRFIHEIDKINILDDDEWIEALEEICDDECEAVDG